MRRQNLKKKRLKKNTPKTNIALYAISGFDWVKIRWYPGGVSYRAPHGANRSLPYENLV